MKKIYIEPEICILSVDEDLPIAVSGVRSNNGAGWGGFDNTGREADAPKRRRSDSYWD